MSEEGSFNRKYKVLVPFLSDQKIGRQGTLPILPPLFLPKSSDQNFEVPILLIIVERPNYHALGYNMTPPPIAPGERSLSYKICPLFTHSICY